MISNKKNTQTDTTYIIQGLRDNNVLATTNMRVIKMNTYYTEDLKLNKQLQAAEVSILIKKSLCNLIDLRRLIVYTAKLNLKL